MSSRVAGRTKPLDGFVLDLHGAFIRRTDLSGANLSGANFAGADCTGVIFRNANLKDAVFDNAILRGADFTGARNLTWDQLSVAIFDEATKLPAYLKPA